MMEARKVILTICIVLLEFIGIAYPEGVLALIQSCLSPLTGIYKVIVANGWLQIVIDSCICAYLFYFVVKREINGRGSLYLGAILTAASILSFNIHQLCLVSSSFVVFLSGITTVWLFMMALVEISFALAQKIRGVKSRVDYSQGLVTDSVKSVTKGRNDLGRIEYAKTLAKRIFSTDASEEAFALSINGPWGSGKTTFKNYLQEQLRSLDPNCNCIEFSPWLYSRPEQITKDFFQTIRKLVGVDNKELDIDLKQYAKLLLSVSGFDVTQLISFLGPKDKTLDNLRDEINRRLKTSESKVFIFIDDIDRLDNKEVVEVLRLIRNTANFSNLVYIAFFDRKYVENALTSTLNDVALAKRYIDKIFQLEISLPVFEGSAKIYELVNMLTSYLLINEEDSSAIKNEILSAQSRDLVVNVYLPTFRDVKRYANLLLVSISQFWKGSLHSSEISLRDLIWLEMILYLEPEVYYELAANPTLRLLRIENSSNNDEKQYVYQNSSEKEKTFKSHEILRWLFPDNINTHKQDEKNSIGYTHNYYKYFALRPLANQASRDQFNSLIEHCDYDEMENCIKNWCSDEYDKTTSLYYLFYDVDIKKLKVDEQVFYTKFLFEFVKNFHVNNQQIGTLFMLKYMKDNFTKEAVDKLKPILKDGITNISNNITLCITGAHILSSMYPHSWYEDNKEVNFPQCLLDKDEIKCLLISMFQAFTNFVTIEGRDLCSNTIVSNFILACYYWNQDSTRRYRVQMIIEDEFCKYTKEHFTQADINDLEACYNLKAFQPFGVSPFESTPDVVKLKSKIEASLGSVDFYVKIFKEGLDKKYDENEYLSANKLDNQYNPANK